MHSLRLQIPLATTMSFLSNNIKKLPFLSNNHAESCKTNSSLLRFRLAERKRSAVSATHNEKNQTEMAAGLEPELIIPKHVAVIMDGNRRWAHSKGLPAHHGHRAGEKAFEQLLSNCLKSGVKVLTVFVFSTENWARPKEEIDLAFDFLIKFIRIIVEKLTQNEVRLSFIGRRERFSELLKERMSDLEEATKDYKRMHLVMAFDYSGRYDMAEATKRIATKVKDGVLQVEDVDDAVFEQHLGTNVIDEFPNPDLLIRSSGELRISNFMLWQLAYTEMFFTEKLFPEFDDTDFMEAIAAFQRRQRRFGGQKH